MNINPDANRANSKAGTMRLPLLLIILSLLAACSQAAPECADEQTKSTAMEIVQQRIAEQSGADALKQIKLKLANIRTADFDDKIGKYTCAADLEITGPGGSKRLPIQYTSELADGGKRFYVTVYGL